jgi:hypothetical protein
MFIKIGTIEKVMGIGLLMAEKGKIMAAKLPVLPVSRFQCARKEESLISSTILK